MDPIVFVAHKGGTIEVQDPGEAFDRAAEAYRENRYAEALALFDETALDHKNTQHARSSLYNAGLCLEQLDRKPEAAERFRKLADDYPDAPEALDALFRLGATLAQLKQWPEAAAAQTRILARKGLTLSDQVEAHARLGEARFEQGRFEDAEHTLREMRELYRQHAQEERLDTDYFLAMGSFYFAEVSRSEYRLLPTRLPQKQLEQDFEAKARMVLLAQQRYVDAMRVKHPEWATAAGFRIASLFREFYDDFVNAPVPVTVKGEAREVYLEEVRKKVRTLLVKAVAFHEKNVLMAERVGETNDWVKRSNEQLAELRQLLEPKAPLTLLPTPESEPPRPVAPVRDPGGNHTTM